MKLHKYLIFFYMVLNPQIIAVVKKKNSIINILLYISNWIWYEPLWMNTNNSIKFMDLFNENYSLDVIKSSNKTNLNEKKLIEQWLSSFRMRWNFYEIHKNFSRENFNIFCQDIGLYIINFLEQNSEDIHKYPQFILYLINLINDNYYENLLMEALGFYWIIGVSCVDNLSIQNFNYILNKILSYYHHDISILLKFNLGILLGLNLLFIEYQNNPKNVKNLNKIFILIFFNPNDKIFKYFHRFIIDSYIYFNQEHLFENLLKNHKIQNLFNNNHSSYEDQYNKKSNVYYKAFLYLWVYCASISNGQQNKIKYIG